MKKLTFDELEELINSDLFSDNDVSAEQFFYHDVYSCADDIEDNDELKKEWEKLGSYSVVEDFGGEGQGDTYYIIYKFIDHDVYIKFDGWYASHAGAEYNKMYEVFPKEKTITVYETA